MSPTARSPNPIARYARWLHTMWPAGTVEQLPRVNEDYSTNIPGLYIVGDLTGIPLLKFSSDSGARAVRTIASKIASQPRSPDRGPVLDLVIIGGGVSGMAAALEAQASNLRFETVEASEPFSTVVNFPKAKPIYTYPSGMTPAGELQFRSEVHPKEQLLEDLRRETIEKGIVPKVARAERVVRKGDLLDVSLADGRPSLPARNVIVAIGRSGNFRNLNVPGEDLNKVYNRLHDPKDFAGKDVLVVGGGDSALETTIAVAECGGRVTLSYRKADFSRPKPENVEKLNALLADPNADVQVEKPASERVTTAVGDYMGVHRKSGVIRLMLSSKVKRIDERDVVITDATGADVTLPNDAVFTMIGREPPLDFLRRSGVKIAGDRGAMWWVTLVAFLIFCVWMYHWKKEGVTVTGIESVDRVVNVGNWWHARNWFPYDASSSLKSLGGAWANPKNLLGTLRISLGEAGFWYSVAYCACVVGFGIDRMRRKRTPYVRWQTTALMLFQVIPLFLLPYLIFPWMGHNGAFDNGIGKWFADTFLPLATYTEHGREYWRAFGFILAWPLFIWNVFTSQPMWGWLILSFVQTFVLIPLIIYFWGKGAYCGWVCSCGALAETLGDRHRHKMPHGPGWNRFNMLGQVFLLFAFVLLALRILSWSLPAPLTAQIVEVIPLPDRSTTLKLSVPAESLRGFAKLEYAPGRADWFITHDDGTVEVSDNIDEWVAPGQQVVAHSLVVTRVQSSVSGWFDYLFTKIPIVNYVWFVDLLWAGILGVGLYFWFSGRVWCRFACPLAALMHIYHRFSRFRILADKKRCISCNVCTSVCHQGIDVMNFANKGLPMADPQCVRCSACVQECPTGVLEFGQVDRKTGATIKKDPSWLAASPVLIREIRVNGKALAV